MLVPVGLNPDQLCELTGFRRNAKQIEALIHMDIPFKVRPDGSPFVSLKALEPAEQGRNAKPNQQLVLNLI